MNDQTSDELEAQLKSIIIEGMKHSIEGLSYENIPDHIFNFVLQSLQNGMRFLVNAREEKGLKKNE
jgi:hypothetical protein